LKFGYDKDRLTAEYKAWVRLVGDVTSVYMTTLIEQDVLVMPFTFHIQNRSGQYKFMLSSWGDKFYDNLVDDFPLSNDEKDWISIQLENFPVSNAIEGANQLFLEKSCIHEDIHLRHVALLPVFDSQQHISYLKPTMIDLASVIIDSEKDFDPCEMNKAFANLIAAVEQSKLILNEVEHAHPTKRFKLNCIAATNYDACNDVINKHFASRPIIKQTKNISIPYLFFHNHHFNSHHDFQSKAK